MKRINWTAQDAAELHASVLIAAAAACHLTDEKAETFLRHIAVSLMEQAQAATNPHVTEALEGVAAILYATSPPRLCEVIPMRRAN